jgi:putrescine transport system permease protein
MKRSRWLALLPLLWLLVFGLFPYLVLTKVSLSEQVLAQPPYTPLFVDGSLHVNLDNYRSLEDDPIYLRAYFSSLGIAAVATLVCLLIGYPLAYAIARSPEPWRLVLLMAVILPFWTSFLIRVYALVGLLRPTGVINQWLQWLGVIDQPLPMLHNSFAVVLGISYAYLPFMVLPLYAVLVRHDPLLLEAASDLGASRLRRFITVTIPLSLPGIVGGCLLVFIPAVGEFVIPALLGGPDTLMIGRVLWNEFFLNGDWPRASAIAIVMMIVLVAPLVVFERWAGRAAQ